MLHREKSIGLVTGNHLMEMVPPFNTLFKYSILIIIIEFQNKILFANLLLALMYNVHFYLQIIFS